MTYPIDRRAVLAGATAGGMALAATGTQAQPRGATPAPEIYELRSYHLVNGPTRARLDAYLRDAFDVLYAEGETAPKMMSVGLHCRLAGRPGRAAALLRFLDYIGDHDRVWTATRLDIAQHWHREHKALAERAPVVA